VFCANGVMPRACQSAGARENLRFLRCGGDLLPSPQQGGNAGCCCCCCLVTTGVTADFLLSRVDAPRSGDVGWAPPSERGPSRESWRGRCGAQGCTLLVGKVGRRHPVSAPARPAMAAARFPARRAGTSRGPPHTGGCRRAVGGSAARVGRRAGRTRAACWPGAGPQRPRRAGRGRPARRTPAARITRSDQRRCPRRARSRPAPGPTSTGTPAVRPYPFLRSGPRSVREPERLPPSRSVGAQPLHASRHGRWSDGSRSFGGRVEEATGFGDANPTKGPL
jgi:hypothetical protein